MRTQKLRGLSSCVLWLPVAVSLGACASEPKAADPSGEDGTDEPGSSDPEESPSAPGKLDAGTRADGAVRRDARVDDGVRDDAGPSMRADGAAAPVDASVTPDARASSYDWKPGDYPADRRAQTYLELKGLPTQGDRVRGYKVHVPPGYKPDVAMPVVYSFHGLMQNAVMFTVDGTALVATSDKEGFVLVMPNGVQDGGGGSWNGGVCCGAAATGKLDDVAFVRAIHDEVSKHLNIDQGRVYATGLSNGAFMTHRLGCDAADLFVAIAPLAGSIGTAALGAVGTNPDPDQKTCAPSQPVAVLAMHGAADGIVPYAGMKPSLDHWAKENGCRATTQPASTPMSGGDTTCVSYEGCPAGIEVTGCTVTNGGHCWFGDASCGTGAPGIGNLFVGNNSNHLDATLAAWQFLSRFHR